MQSSRRSGKIRDWIWGDASTWTSARGRGVIRTSLHGRPRGTAVTTEKTEDPDRDLVERAQAELPYGTTAYNEIIRKYSSRIYARAYGILRSRPDAEEAVQDVFVAVFRILPRFRFERPFLHCLNTVSLNACRMILRKRASEQRRRKTSEEKEPPPERPAPPDHAQRQCFPELAEEMDLTESAVKMRVYRDRRCPANVRIRFISIASASDFPT